MKSNRILAIVLAALSISAFAQSTVQSGSEAGAQAYLGGINFQPQYFSSTSPFTMGYQHITGQPVAQAGTAIPTQGSAVSCYKPGAALGYQKDTFGLTASLGALFGLADDQLCDIGRAKNIVQEIEGMGDSVAKRVAKRIACMNTIIADAYEAEDRISDRCEVAVRMKDRTEQERAARDPRNRAGRQQAATSEAQVNTPVAAGPAQQVWLP